MAITDAVGATRRPGSARWEDGKISLQCLFPFVGGRVILPWRREWVQHPSGEFSSLVAGQGPGIVAFAHVRAIARARAGSAAWCRRPAAMLSHPAMRSRLMATFRQVAMTRGACPVRTWDWSSA